ncbi:NlpC/P60 family protein [Marinactinospora rubrisoli]|uniref:NlpC/P60 family protein n=1 Tax=Marinactinospora rubrisoli TaxID=2715399 RepID=A0ABW2KLY8_9ACTN
MAAVGFVAAGALVLSPGVANAEPTPDEVREQIEQLEQEFSELNEAYNAAQQDHEAAQKKLEDIQQELEDTEADLESLRGSVRSLANAAYSGTDYSSPAYLLSSSGPEDVLRHAADVGYLSSSQEQSLVQYSEKRETLESLQDEAEQTEQEAQDRLDEAEEARDEGEQKMEEQQELLDSLTAEEQSDATSGVGAAEETSSGGASYHGSASGDARIALEFAYAQVGKPYIWGGTGPDGYDCSGLTQAAWAEAGVSLPRVSQDQFHAGTRVSWDELQPGDLLFFYDSSAPTHVGMYAGDNQMVHASTSSKPIGVVELSDYYRTNFVGGVRP